MQIFIDVLFSTLEDVVHTDIFCTIIKIGMHALLYHFSSYF